ncbi:MAG: nicotinamide mononucleotide transporter family protein [Actinomycetota bacterium]|nr:nicotinamide mononucleotide transporter family protein [Actinomycetota bacterium]
MDLLRWLFDAKPEFAGGGFLLWREVLGNLFTVFRGSVFGSPVYADLLGQAGRQLMLIAVSVFGWYRWRQPRQTGKAWSTRAWSTRAGSTRAGSASAGSTSAAVEPRWASGKVRVGLVAGMIGGTAQLTPMSGAPGSYPPVRADAWIFYGAFTLTGFFVWWRVRNRNAAAALETAVPDQAVAL